MTTIELPVFPGLSQGNLKGVSLSHLYLSGKGTGTGQINSFRP